MPSRTAPSEAVDAKQFAEALEALRSDAELTKYERAFKFDKNLQHEDDVFIGVRMGEIFKLAKESIDMPLDEVEALLESPIHEMRVGGVAIMDWQARRKATPAGRRKELYDLYLRRHDRIDGWDLVDRAAPHVVGGYLYEYDEPRDVLYELARSEDVWERRTAIVSTGYFIRKGDVTDGFRISELLVADPHALIHKAVGWMLRECGKQDRDGLLRFLDRFAARMPRTMLRYAMEHLDQGVKEHYRGLKSAS